MDSSPNTAVASDSCGTCRKKIRMRDYMNLVLCTAILDVVPLDQQVCEHYEESAAQAEELFARGM